MQLIFTAQENLPEHVRSDILLIEHCLADDPYIKKCNRKHFFVDHPWDNKIFFLKDYNYATLLTRKLIRNLASNLNTYHNLEFSENYWATATERSFITIIDTFFEQYRLIECSLNFNIDEILVPEKFKNNNLIFEVGNLKTKEMRAFLYFFIFSNHSRTQKIKKKFIPSAEVGIKRVSAFKFNILNDLTFNKIKFKLMFFLNTNFTRLLNFLPSFKSRLIILGKLKIPFWRIWALKIYFRSINFTFDGIKVRQKKSNIDPKKREKLITLNPTNEFEKVLFKILPFLISDSYLENFEAIRKELKDKAPYAPKVIFTLDFVKTDRITADVWVAECKERYNTKVICHQHGGGYGTCLFDRLTEFQIKRFSDVFYPYNRITAKEIKTKKMPSLILSNWSKMAKKPFNRPSGSIVIMFTHVLPYYYNIASRVNGKKFLDYIEFYKTFMKNIDDENRHLFAARLSGEDPWNLRSKFAEVFTDDQYSYANYNFFSKKSDVLKQLKYCRLAIHTQDTTALQETMVANFPTIALWDPNIELQSKDGEKLFEKLKTVGILHECPLTASNFINKNINELEEWWSSEPVQKVRDEFCSAVAYTHKDFLKIWKLELENNLKKL